MNYTIGLDLDNTIVSYDNLMHKVALELGLISKNSGKSKKCIRDTIRKLSDGEVKWQELQAIVYGPRMKEAELIKGVEHFFKLCKKNKIKVYIISHKTQFANYDTTRTNLRTAAFDWMERNKFFKEEVFSLLRKNVHFESSRAEKIRRIGQLGCTHFIDDLEETFIESSFPQEIEKILYDPHDEHLHLHAVRVFRTWEDINEYFFNSRK